MIRNEMKRNEKNLNARVSCILWFILCLIGFIGFIVNYIQISIYKERIGSFETWPKRPSIDSWISHFLLLISNR